MVLAKIKKNYTLCAPIRLGAQRGNEDVVTKFLFRKKLFFGRKTPVACGYDVMCNQSDICQCLGLVYCAKRQRGRALAKRPEGHRMTYTAFLYLGCKIRTIAALPSTFLFGPRYCNADYISNV